MKKFKKSIIAIAMLTANIVGSPLLNTVFASSDKASVPEDVTPSAPTPSSATQTSQRIIDGNVTMIGGREEITSTIAHTDTLLPPKTLKELAILVNNITKKPNSYFEDTKVVPSEFDDDYHKGFKNYFFRSVLAMFMGDSTLASKVAKRKSIVPETRTMEMPMETTTTKLFVELNLFMHSPDMRSSDALSQLKSFHTLLKRIAESNPTYFNNSLTSLLNVLEQDIKSAENKNASINRIESSLVYANSDMLKYREKYNPNVAGGDFCLVYTVGSNDKTTHRIITLHRG